MLNAKGVLLDALCSAPAVAAIPIINLRSILIASGNLQQVRADTEKSDQTVVLSAIKFPQGEPLVNP